MHQTCICMLGEYSTQSPVPLWWSGLRDVRHLIHRHQGDLWTQIHRDSESSWSGPPDHEMVYVSGCHHEYEYSGCVHRGQQDVRAS